MDLMTKIKLNEEYGKYADTDSLHENTFHPSTDEESPAEGLGLET
jgi:hypothetical protein